MLSSRTCHTGRWGIGPKAPRPARISGPDLRIPQPPSVTTPQAGGREDFGQALEIGRTEPASGRSPGMPSRSVTETVHLEGPVRPDQPGDGARDRAIESESAAQQRSHGEGDRDTVGDAVESAGTASTPDATNRAFDSVRVAPRPRWARAEASAITRASASMPMTNASGSALPVARTARPSPVPKIDDDAAIRPRQLDDLADVHVRDATPDDGSHRRSLPDGAAAVQPRPLPGPRDL